MNSANRTLLHSWKMATVLLVFYLLPALAALPQQSEETDGARNMWNMRFVATRGEQERKQKKAPSPPPAKSKSGKKKTVVKSEEKDKTGSKTEIAITAFPAADQEKSESEGGGGELIGLTLWRLREAGAGEDPNRRRSLRQKDKEKEGAQLIPERVDSDTVFNNGDLVRLSIEVPRLVEGYLYVIDREVFADGKMGSPYLIFPATSTPKDGNILTAGQQIYVPAFGDRIPYFTLGRSDDNHVAEKLTIIVSPIPLPVTPGLPEEGRLLDPALVEEWEKKWGATTERRESRSKAPRQWTEAEKEADEGKRRLRQVDPLPHTIYRVDVKPGSAVLVHLQMQISK